MRRSLRRTFFRPEVGISLNGGRFESFVFFVLLLFFFVLVFTLGCRFCHERSVFVPFQKYGSILKTFKTIRVVLTFTRLVENPTDDKLTHVD